MIYSGDGLSAKELSLMRGSVLVLRCRTSRYNAWYTTINKRQVARRDDGGADIFGR